MSSWRFDFPLSATQIAEAVLSPDQISDIPDLFEKMGSARARIEIEPRPDQIRNYDVRQLLVRYIEQSEKHGACPPWSSFSLQENKSLLGNLHVLSILKETGGLFFEIFGTNVAARYERDFTKTALPLQGITLSVIFHGIFQAAIKSRNVIYTIHEPPPGGTIKDCQRLILPYCGEDGEVHRLVVAHKPVSTARGLVGGVV